VRYLVQGPAGAGADWPARQYGHAALMPQLVRMAASGAQQYKDGVTGQPGTQAISVQPVIPSPDVGDTALSGTSRSSDAPDAFYPNLYWARPERGFYPGAGMPVSVSSDNLMPVPAVDPRGIPAVLSNRVRQRGQAQIQSQPNLPRWASQGGS
jgi:hypothetical protein